MRYRSAQLWFAVVLAVLTAGCDSAAPYRTTLRAQAKALEELARILGTVTDKASMQAARAQLTRRFEAFDSIREDAQKLPVPNQDIIQQVGAEGEQVRDALQKVQEQVRRIQALTGGPEFLAGFESMKGFQRDSLP